MGPESYNLPDHPMIRNLEMTGYPDGQEPEYPHCRCAVRSAMKSTRRET